MSELYAILSCNVFYHFEMTVYINKCFMKSFLVIQSPADINLFINIFLHVVYTLHIGWFIVYKHNRQDSIILKIQIQSY